MLRSGGSGPDIDATLERIAAPGLVTHDALGFWSPKAVRYQGISRRQDAASCIRALADTYQSEEYLKASTVTVR